MRIALIQWLTVENLQGFSRHRATTKTLEGLAQGFFDMRLNLIE